MWENYYKLRSSGEFRDMWTIFLRNSINVEASPIFYQFVSDSILDVFINMNIAVTSAGANMYCLLITLKQMQSDMWLVMLSGLLKRNV